MEAGGVGAPAPTIYDVAERAGVSIATVSRVLNGHDYLRPQTRDRVLQAVRDLHFVPNGAARQLSSRFKKVIGLAFVRPPMEGEMLAIEEESLLFTDSVIRGAELCAQRYGYSLLLSGVSEGDSGHEVTSLTGKTDGVILLDRVLPERRLSALAKRSPVVTLAGSGRTRSAASVRVDNVEGMRAVAQHLIGFHGRRRVAFMSGSAESPDSTMRAEAFAAAVSQLGGACEPVEDGWSSDWTSAGAVRVLQRRMSSSEPLPEAIACANDQMAIGVIHALHLKGLHVPGDVTVTGFDDIPVARHLNPALTTVRQPSQQLGSAAVDALVGVIESRPDAFKEIVLPTQLIVRRSCGCPNPSTTPPGLLEEDSWPART
jgi:LacI family transcriptional regulator